MNKMKKQGNSALKKAVNNVTKILRVCLFKDYFITLVIHSLFLKVHAKIDIQTKVFFYTFRKER